jgi:hypothetical protein
MSRVDFRTEAAFVIVSMTHGPTVVHIAASNSAVAHDSLDVLEHAVNNAVCRTLFDAYRVHGDSTNAAAGSAWKLTKVRAAEAARTAAREAAPPESTAMLEDLARDATGVPMLVKRIERDMRAPDGSATARAVTLYMPQDFQLSVASQLGVSLAVVDAMTGLGWEMTEAHAALAEVSLPLVGSAEAGYGAEEQSESFFFRKAPPQLPKGGERLEPLRGAESGSNSLANSHLLRSISNSGAASRSSIADIGLSLSVKPKERPAALRRALDLIEAGSHKINQVDVLGRSVLHWAVDWADDIDSRRTPTLLRSTLLFLLEAGARPHMCDCSGRTPLDLAANKPAVLEVFREFAEDFCGRLAKPLAPVTDVVAEIPSPLCQRAVFSATMPDIMFVVSGAQVAIYDIHLHRFTPIREAQSENPASELTFIVAPFNNHSHGVTTRDVLLFADGLLLGVDYTTADPTVLRLNTASTFDVLSGDGDGCCVQLWWAAADEAPPLVDRSTRVGQHLIGQRPHSPLRRVERAGLRTSIGRDVSLMPFNATGQADGVADDAFEEHSAPASTEPLGYLLCCSQGRLKAAPLRRGLLDRLPATASFEQRMNALAATISQGAEIAIRQSSSSTIITASCRVATYGAAFATSDGDWIVFDGRTAHFTDVVNERPLKPAGDGRSILPKVDIATGAAAIHDGNIVSLVWAGQCIFVDCLETDKHYNAAAVTIRETAQDTETVAVAQRASYFDAEGVYFSRRGDLCRMDMKTLEAAKLLYFPLTESEVRHRRAHGDSVAHVSGHQAIAFNSDGSLMLRHSHVSSCCVVYHTDGVALAHQEHARRRSIAHNLVLVPGHGGATHSIPRERLFSFLRGHSSHDGTKQQRTDHVHYVMAALADSLRGHGSFQHSSTDADGRTPLHIVSTSISCGDLPEATARKFLMTLLESGASLYAVSLRGRRPIDDLITDDISRSCLAHHVQAQHTAFTSDRLPADGAMVFPNARGLQLGRDGRTYFARDHNLVVRLGSGEEHVIHPLRDGTRDVGFAAIPPLPRSGAAIADALPPSVDVLVTEDGAVVVVRYDAACPKVHLSSAPCLSAVQKRRGMIRTVFTPWVVGVSRGVRGFCFIAANDEGNAVEMESLSFAWSDELPDIRAVEFCQYADAICAVIEGSTRLPQSLDVGSVGSLESYTCPLSGDTLAAISVSGGDTQQQIRVCYLDARAVDAPLQAWDPSRFFPPGPQSVRQSTSRRMFVALPVAMLVVGSPFAARSLLWRPQSPYRIRRRSSACERVSTLSPQLPSVALAAGCKTQAARRVSSLYARATCCLSMPSAGGASMSSRPSTRHLRSADGWSTTVMLRQVTTLARLSAEANAFWL